MWARRDRSARTEKACGGLRQKHRPILESCLLQQRSTRKKVLQQQSNDDVIDQQVCSGCADRQTDNLVETHTASS